MAAYRRDHVALTQTDEPVDLPARWGDFKAEATPVSADYVDRCAASLYAANLTESDREYDARRYTRRSDENCGPVVIDGGDIPDGAILEV